MRADIPMSQYLDSMILLSVLLLPEPMVFLLVLFLSLSFLLTVCRMLFRLLLLPVVPAAVSDLPLDFQTSAD
ncbi:MAG: hypothetical protein Tsb009_34710 [Planctomycetaceae bacterium]